MYEVPNSIAEVLRIFNDNIDLKMQKKIFKPI